MSETGLVDQAQRGRPRSERARLALLTATIELLQERDLASISADDIARRAGVSKATIYRWWDSKAALALDAFMDELARREGTPPDTGSLAGDFSASLRARSRALTRNPWMGRTMANLVTLIFGDAALGSAYLAQVVTPLRAQARTFIARAIERGEVPAGVDVEVAIDLIYGPMYHRLFQGHLPITDRFAKSVVDIVVRGLREG
jgi:AcrR family transcriptional regulator